MVAWLPAPCAILEAVNVSVTSVITEALAGYCAVTVPVMNVWMLQKY